MSRQLQELEKHFAVRTYAEQGGLKNCPFPFFSVTKGSRHRGLKEDATKRMLLKGRPRGRVHARLLRSESFVVD